MSTKNDVILLHEISKLATKQARWEPYAWFKEMREKNPVFYDPKQDVWNVFLFDDVKAVLFDHQFFSNSKERSFVPVPRVDNRANINFVDPPEHRKRRGLVAHAFTPRRLEEWRPKIQAVVDELVTQMEGQATVDITKGLAVPLPVTVIAFLLGVASQDLDGIKSWSDILFRPFDDAEAYGDMLLQKQRAMKEFSEYLFPIVAEKRMHPSDDIISDLTKAELEGEQLTDAEVVMSSIGLLGAGNETTTMLISNMFYSMLFDQPGIYQDLRNDVSLVPKLVEEVLRFRFPGGTMDRQVAQDNNMFGHEMKQGQMVVTWIASANRDESRFAAADQFNIHRPGNQQHLTFGAGAHFCLGAPLARLEANLALTTFVQRVADIQPIDSFNVVEHLSESGLSFESLPIRLVNALNA